MTTETRRPVRPARRGHRRRRRLAGAHADRPAPEPASEGAVKAKDFLIIDYSGDLEKVWATMILASTSAAMGVQTRVFVTFWGLQVFVKDSKRITGENWMQKMLSAMQRPGISHREALEDELPRDGALDDGHAWPSSTAWPSPKELLEAAQLMGVEFIPCQMTMDMFGLKPEDMIEGMAEPAGAATVIGLLTEDSVFIRLFI